MSPLNQLYIGVLVLIGERKPDKKVNLETSCVIVRSHGGNFAVSLSDFFELPEMGALI